MWTLWAQADLSHWLISGGAVALAVAASTALGKYLNGRTARKLREQKGAIDHLNTVADRLEKQTGELQAALNRTTEAHSECRERLQQVYGWAHEFHGYAVRLGQALAEQTGRPAEAVPELPALPRSPLTPAQSEYLARSSAESGRLIHELRDNPPEPRP